MIGNSLDSNNSDNINCNDNDNEYIRDQCDSLYLIIQKIIKIGELCMNTVPVVVKDVDAGSGIIADASPDTTLTDIITDNNVNNNSNNSNCYKHELKSLFIELTDRFRWLVGRIPSYVGATHQYKASSGPSPTALSINQLRAVYTTLELIWELELVQHVQSSIDINGDIEGDIGNNSNSDAHTNIASGTTANTNSINSTNSVSHRIFSNLQYPKTLLIVEPMIRALVLVLVLTMTQNLTATTLGSAPYSSDDGDELHCDSDDSVTQCNPNPDPIPTMHEQWRGLQLYLDAIQCHAFSSFMLQRHLKRAVVSMLCMLRVVINNKGVCTIGSRDDLGMDCGVTRIQLINTIQYQLHRIVCNNITAVASEFRVLSLAAPGPGSGTGSGSGSVTGSGSGGGESCRWLKTAVSTMMSHLLAGKPLYNTDYNYNCGRAGVADGDGDGDGDCVVVQRHGKGKDDNEVEEKANTNLEQLLKGYLEGKTDSACVCICIYIYM